MSTLLAMWFANIFSQSLSLSFHLLEGFFFGRAKVLLFFFYYGLYFYGVMSKSYLSSCRSQMASPIFFSKSFRALCFTFKCMIHLSKFCGRCEVYIEVYFFFFWHIDVQLLQQHLLEMLIFIKFLLYFC